MKKRVDFIFIISLIFILSFSLVSANLFTDFFNRFFGDDEVSLSPINGVYVNNYCMQVGGYDVFGNKVGEGYGISDDELVNCYPKLDGGQFNSFNDVLASQCQDYVCALYRGVQDKLLTNDNVDKRCAQDTSGWPLDYVEANCATWCASGQEWSSTQNKCISSNKVAGSVCGNGILEDGESCDGQQLGGLTCSLLGYDGGLLKCSAQCVLDKSGCFYDAQGGEICGNGILETGEQCDDGNILSGDGCNGVCQINYGWSCTLNNQGVSVCKKVDVQVPDTKPGNGTTPTPTTYCGNGICESGETTSSCLIDCGNNEGSPSGSCTDVYEGTGECKAKNKMFVYNSATNVCEQKSWGGCYDVNVPFTTKEECEGVCVPSEYVNRCPDGYVPIDSSSGEDGVSFYLEENCLGAEYTINDPEANVPYRYDDRDVCRRETRTSVNHKSVRTNDGCFEAVATTGQLSEVEEKGNYPQRSCRFSGNLIQSNHLLGDSVALGGKSRFLCFDGSVYEAIPHDNPSYVAVDPCTKVGDWYVDSINGIWVKGDSSSCNPNYCYVDLSGSYLGSQAIYASEDSSPAFLKNNWNGDIYHDLLCYQGKFMATSRHRSYSFDTDVGENCFPYGSWYYDHYTLANSYNVWKKIPEEGIPSDCKPNHPCSYQGVFDLVGGECIKQSFDCESKSGSYYDVYTVANKNELAVRINRYGDKVADSRILCYDDGSGAKWYGSRDLLNNANLNLKPNSEAEPCVTYGDYYYNPSLGKWIEITDEGIPSYCTLSNACHDTDISAGKDGQQFIPGNIIGAYNDGSEYLFKDSCSANQEGVLIERECSIVLRNHPDDLPTKNFNCQLGCATDENGQGYCKDYPVQNFDNPITARGDKFYDGSQIWNPIGFVYTTDLYATTTESAWQSKQQLIDNDMRQIAIKGFNTIYVLGDACNIDRFARDGISIDRFNWFLATAERFGLRVFADCITHPSLTGQAGGDGYSSPEVMPIFYNENRRNEIYETVADYMNSIDSDVKNTFMGYQIFPSKFGVNEIVQCNDVIGCKAAWGGYLVDTYGDFDTLEHVWGSDAFTDEELSSRSLIDVKAGWQPHDFSGDARKAEARRVDWQEFELSQQEQLFTELQEKVPRPMHSELQTWQESWIGDAHKHDSFIQGWDATGQENYARSGFIGGGFYKNNLPYELGFSASLVKLWGLQKPFYQGSAYGIGEYKPEEDSPEASEYYNAILPLMLTTDTAGYYNWEYNKEMLSSTKYQTLAFWANITQNYNLQATPSKADVLIVVPYNQFIQTDINSFQVSPMAKLPTVTNSLMQLGVNYDVKYSSEGGKVISLNTLNNYKLIIYLGDDVDYEYFDDGNNFEENLISYVEQGGTLFMYTALRKNHKNEHGKDVFSSIPDDLIYGIEELSLNTQFTNYQWQFTGKAGEYWNFGTKDYPVIADPLPKQTLVERKWANYVGLYDKSEADVISTDVSGVPTLARLTYPDKSGKVILSAYNLAFLRDIGYTYTYHYEEGPAISCSFTQCFQRNFFDQDNNFVGSCKVTYYSSNPYVGDCPWKESTSTKRTQTDSSQFNWLFEGLLKEAELGNEIEVIGNRGDKIYNLKADGQRLILNEYTKDGEVNVRMDDCGYEGYGLFKLPANGSFLVNSNIVVTNAKRIGGGPALPLGANIIATGPNDYFVAEFDSPVSCNGVILDSKKVNNKNIFVDAWQFIKNLFP